MAYDAPTPADFLERFPEFSDLYESNDFLQLLLDEAGRRVDTTWLEGDYAKAIMYLAAHMLSIHNGQMDSGGSGIIRSESLGRISVSYGAATTATKPSILGTTEYGQEFLSLAKRNFPPVLIV